MSPNIDVLAIGDGSKTPNNHTNENLWQIAKNITNHRHPRHQYQMARKAQRPPKLNICENVHKCRQIDILDISTDGSECRKTTKKRISENLQT